MQEKNLNYALNCISKQWITIVGIILTSAFIVGMFYQKINSNNETLLSHTADIKINKDNISAIKTDIETLKTMTTIISDDLKQVKRYLMRDKDK